VELIKQKTMKKIFYTVLTLCVSLSAFAQDAADKKVQAGLTIGGGLNFQKMGTKQITTNGAGNDLTIGANVIFNFTETIGLCTGAEFDFETLKYKSAGYEDNNIYYFYNDTEIQQVKDVDFANPGANKLYQLTTRTQKAVYLTVPTMMVFRTKFFGYLRYFGKFGLRNSFLLTSKANDTGFNFANNDVTDTPVAGDNTGMRSTGEMFFFKSAVGLTAGAEWNFSGSTCLVGEIGYYYGFTPLHVNKNVDKGNNFFFATDENNGLGNNVQFNNKATQSQLMLKISILF